ncbi:MAG: TolC family protein [Acidobacteriota bacterium]|nr:TolC family protein [Acidobacteriota bacterium]
MRTKILAACGGFAALALLAFGPSVQPARAQTNALNAAISQESQAAPQPVAAGAPLTLTLADALARAQKNSPDFQRALAAVKIAKSGQTQARAAMLPSFTNSTQYLNAQGNGISPVGRYVTQDGIHVYREWLVTHEDMPGSFFLDLGPKKAAYQKAVAVAGAEIAKRSLVVTVTQDYYALLVAQRAYATAQTALAEGQHFLQISQQLEQGGEVAHQGVIRFQLQVSQAQRDLGDAQVLMEQARLNLAVLLFPAFNEDFTVVDDLDTPPVLPDFKQIEAIAKDHNPAVASALASYNSARVDVASARTDFLPSFSIDVDYGIEANRFALESVNNTVLTPNPITGKPPVQPNLGYFVTYSMNIPVWDWGARIGKLHQAEEQRSVAKLDLLFAQRKTLALLHSDYDESQVAWNQLTTLRQSVDLAQQNLQLVTMQYQAGEAAVLDVLDAETSLATARNAYATGEARYRNALAALQTVTGSF